jgi:hypothetical protein
MKLPALLRPRAKSAPQPRLDPPATERADPSPHPAYPRQRPAADREPPPPGPSTPPARLAEPPPLGMRPRPRFIPAAALQHTSAVAPEAEPNAALAPRPAPNPALAQRPAPHPPAAPQPPKPPQWTARSIIGDELRVPTLSCQFGSCGTRFTHPDALGERDLPHLAVAAGWRYDTLSRLACPSCAQHDPTFWPRRAPTAS